MERPSPSAELALARDYVAMFRLVKRLVERHLRKTRGGIMLGLARLGLAPNGFLGGYFVVGSNAIVLNRDVLDYVQVEHPQFHQAYAFHVLLHEYLHTLGYFSEGDVRPLAYQISVEAFGPDHPASQIAAAMAPGVPVPQGAPELFRKLVYPPFGWTPQESPTIEYVRGFDPDAASYIG